MFSYNNEIVFTLLFREERKLFLFLAVADTRRWCWPLWKRSVFECLHLIWDFIFVIWLVQGISELTRLQLV